MSDIITYNDFVNLIKEGLIKTYNIEKYKSSLEIELNSIGIKYNLNILSKYIFELEIMNSSSLENKKLEFILSIIKNILGYYPSYIWIENDFGLNFFKFKTFYLNNRYKYIKIRFESKYEDGLYYNTLDVPKICYHLSPTKNRNKILKLGLYPKSGQRKTYHPDRIYLFYNHNDFNCLLDMLKLTDIDNFEYDLYEISLDDKFIIHSDPNYDKGFYTYDNISPEKIKLIKQNI
jgi:hypothetical protein